MPRSDNRVHTPAQIEVTAIWVDLNETRQEFMERFWFNINEVQ